MKEPKATLTFEETVTNDFPKQVKVFDLLNSTKTLNRLTKKSPFIRPRTSSLDVGHTKEYYNKISNETDIITTKLNTQQKLNTFKNEFRRLHSITDEDCVSCEGFTF